MQQLVVDDEGNGAGVGQGPVAILILRPGRDLLPGAWLVGLRHFLLDRDRTECGTDVADVGSGVVFFGFELGEFLGRTHVGVDMFEAIVLGQVVPGAFPVRPVIGHADTVDFTFRFRRGFQGFQVGISGHGGSADGNGRA
ncbi:hypothetical protein D3C87_1618370 [compost metagenome]